MSNNPYRFNPTKSGFRTVSKYPDDPNREIPCILYPDNRRELIFGGEELEKIFRYPFRPVAMAMLAPKFRMDLHCVSGMAGYGRIAVVRGDLALWLDEFETVECEYVNGEMHYTAQDDRIAEAPVRVVFLAGRGACGMLIQIDARDLGPGTEVYLVYGGMLGWHR